MTKVHLSPEDTWCVWLDADCAYWATEQESHPGTTGWTSHTPGWSVTITEDGESVPMTFGHDDILTAMVRIAQGEFPLRSDIIDLVRDVVNAPDNDSATDAQCQLDSEIDDIIVQIATLGKAVYS